MQRRDLTPFDGVQTQLVGIERAFPGRDPDRPEQGQPAAARRLPVDLRTGELTKEVENPGFVGWVADAS